MRRGVCCLLLMVVMRFVVVVHLMLCRWCQSMMCMVRSCCLCCMGLLMSCELQLVKLVRRSGVPIHMLYRSHTTRCVRLTVPCVMLGISHDECV
jgi:hypothetical protein